MTELSTTPVTWRKSTRSNGSGNCVEVADDLAGKVGVRDSKDVSGPALTFSQAAWSHFVNGLKHPTSGN
ncbi:DUF397 domain-containing protein [Micromonospora sp. NPDC048999]|uniref:DUF397 domain-containing protein n=1 Tax=Micromonospora sp. NPDC048999 TaxID=3155391 RepID=UPI0033CE1242